MREGEGEQGLDACPTEKDDKMKKFYLHLPEKFSLACHAKTSLSRREGRGAFNPFTMQKWRQ
jgi:hypothetical protein